MFDVVFEKMRNDLASLVQSWRGVQCRSLGRQPNSIVGSLGEFSHSCMNYGEEQPTSPVKSLFIGICTRTCAGQVLGEQAIMRGIVTIT